MKVISRAEWGARAESLPEVKMRLPAAGVYIHHSVTPVTANLSVDVRTIETVGLERFGQISYSYLIHPHGGEIFEGCGTRRGAHTAGRNSTAFGICWIGNYDERQPKVQQLESTRWLIAELVRQGHLAADAPVLGHRDVYATACPGSKLYALLDVIRHPWEETMPDDPNLPNLPDIAGFYPIVNTTTGQANGYYILSSDGQLHAFGPGAVFFGRSEVVDQP